MKCFYNKNGYLNKITNKNKEIFKGTLIPLKWHNCKTFTVVTIETTGLDYEKDEIIEIYAAHYQNNNKIDEFYSLAKPNIKILKDASDVNGITNEMLQNALSSEKVMKNFKRFLKISSPILVFDGNFTLPFLAKYFNTFFNIIDKPFIHNYYSLLQATTSILQDEVANYKFSTICKHFNINVEEKRRARADSESMYCLAEKLKNILIEQRAEKLKNMPAFIRKILEIFNQKKYKP